MSTRMQHALNSNQREKKTLSEAPKATECRRFAKCKRLEKDQGRCSMRKCPEFKPK
ncbi:MAG: hypothetical protein U0M00_02095 [Clostridia bacterium]|nr:hypothetical protein [Clostridia bacterium]